MASTVSRSFLAAIAISVAGLITAFFSGQALESQRPTMPAGYDDADLSVHGSRMKGFVLGFEGLMADWYWVRSLQYIGNKMIAADAAQKDVNLDDLRDLDPRLLYPYLENATDLDPRFIAAYSYGALVLPAIDKEKAIAFTKKGIANNPKEWRLYQYLGYIYWKLGRYDEASEIYDAGSRVEGSGNFMRLMAASMKTEGGSRSTARQIYQQMLYEAPDESVKITAERRLAQLDAIDEREAMDKVLADLKERTGRCVNDLREINQSLTTVKLPSGGDFRVDQSRRLVDPTGVPYVLDQKECKAILDLEKTGVAR